VAVAAAVLWGLLGDGEAGAEVVFFDDFEAADPVGTILPDSPPVGENWVKRNPDHVDSNIAANPEIEARNSSSLVYRMYRPDPRFTSVSIMLAPISAVDTALIAANKAATIEFKYYELDITSGGNNGTGGLNIIANEAPAVAGTLPVNSSTGLSMSNGGFHQTGFGNVPGISFTTDDWHDVRLDIDFIAKNYLLSLNGVAGPTLPFTDATATTIRHLWLSYSNQPAEYFIDDLRVTTVPEPTTLALVCLSLLGVASGLVRRRK
jgi:hypothetical protein